MSLPAQDIQRFHLERTQYQRIHNLGWLFVVGLLILASGTITLGIWLWGTYTHGFTPYLKWQDALLSLSWFVSFVALSGSVLVGRFLYALRAGYRRGMITLRDTMLTVRDLSADNLRSIFWLLNSAFWCAVAVLVGLMPIILIRWTLQITNVPLMIIATSLSIVVGLASLVVSIIAFSFIIIGCFGGVSFGRNLGWPHLYELNGRTSLSIEHSVLTIIQPDRPETMLELRLLTTQDRVRLLSLLRQNWVASDQKWSPGLDEEIDRAQEVSSIS